MAKSRHCGEYDILVGQRLRQLRCDAGLTQDKLSEYLDITFGYYGQVERGERRLSRNLAIKLSGFYQVTLDYLYYGDQNYLICEESDYGNKGELIRYIKTCSESDCEYLLPIVRIVRQTLWACGGRQEK